MCKRTRMFSRVVACAFLSLAALAAAPAAHADTLTVTAKGTIQPTCSMSATQQFSAADFTASGSATAKTSITCNQFFKMNATSANGLVKTSAPSTNGFGNTLPYSLKADLTLDGGSTSATCASSTLLAGQSSCALSPANSTGLTSNGQIATNKTTNLTVSWGSALLVPGSYSDTLTLTIAVVP